MWELGLFILIVVAIAIGWYLGRRSLSQRHVAAPNFLHKPYYQGLNHLINDESDRAVEAFIQALEVSSDTFELHISLGNLLRRKGEVDRAIRIHQNLLARPSLAVEYRSSAHLELARDYMAAGLYDRAERLLLDIIAAGSELRERCLLQLLEIYQLEKDWQKAIDTAQQLRSKNPLKRESEADKAIARQIAHFHCELAENAIADDNLRLAGEHLRRALHVDKNCARASMLSSQLDVAYGEYQRALKMLRKFREQDPKLTPLSLPQLQLIYLALDDHKSYMAELEACLAVNPSIPIVLAMTDELERDGGELEAVAFLGEQLKVRPSLKGLARLIEYHIAHSEGKAKENLSLLQNLVAALIANRNAYRCRECGFQGHEHHWQCPSCKRWGVVEMMFGIEGS